MRGKIRLTRALGEFSVIVLGVFAALAADSWYERWSENRGLEGYLDRLIVDLEADSATFVFVASMLDVKDEALDEVARVSLGIAPPDSTFFQSLYRTETMGFQTPGAQRATYDDMIATGNLRLIDDPVLRARVVAYYDDIESQWLRIEQRRTGYPHAIYRLNPTPWNRDGFTQAFSALAQQALDSVTTPGFANLISAERNLSFFQQERMAAALSSVREVLAAVRHARESVS